MNELVLTQSLIDYLREHIDDMQPGQVVTLDDDGSGGLIPSDPTNPPKDPLGPPTGPGH
jgi:hypothetical protein